MSNNPTPNQYPAGFYATPRSSRNDHPPPPPPPPGRTIPSAAVGQSYLHNYGSVPHHPQAWYYPPSISAEGGGGAYLNTARGYDMVSLPPPPPPARLPRTEEFRCQPCNLTLQSALALQSHAATHVQCEQCDFAAAPKVVKGHFAAVHGKFSGNGFKTVTVAIPGVKVQRFQICIGNRPEDIQRWIAERRQRFPRQSTTPSATELQQKQPKEPTPNDAENTTGLSSLLAGYGSSSSEDEDNTKGGIKSKADEQPPVTAGNEQESTAISSPAGNNYRTRPCRFFMRNGKCRNGDSCKFSHTICSHQQPQQHEKPTRDVQPHVKKQRVREFSSSTRHAKPSLLQNLLANDVKRESILTLQLLDYIVRSDFLKTTLK